MTNRITIPSSELDPEGPPEGRARRSPRNPLIVTVFVALSALVVGAAWTSSRGSNPEDRETTQIASPIAPEDVFPSEPEPATRGSTALIPSVEIPGPGGAVAGFDYEGAQHLVVSEQWFASSRSILWRRDPTAWVVAGAIDGPVTHAAEWRGQIVATGAGWPLEETFVYVGTPDDLVPVGLGGSNDVAFRVEALGDHVAVYSQSREPQSEVTNAIDLREATGFTARLSSDGRNWVELPETVFDVAETSRGLLAVGESDLDPRIWRVEDGTRLVETDLVPPSSYRPVSVLESDGELMVLAISRGLGRDAEIWRTVRGRLAVVATLDTSVWTRLETRGDGYVAFGDGSYYATSRAGREWNIVALRNDVPGGWEPHSARVTETGLEFYGSRFDQGPVMLTTSADVPFTLPESEWELVERLPDEFVAFDPGVRGDLAVTTSTSEWGRLLFRDAGSKEWQETDSPQISEWHQVLETGWGWVLQTDESTLRSFDGLTWEQVVKTSGGGILSPFDGDVIVSPWSGDESYVVGEQTVWHLPATGDESTIGYVDGVGVVALGFSGRSSTAKLLVDGAWQRLELESLNGWPSFAFGRLFMNSIDGGEVGVFDPSSGEFVPVGGPTVRGQIVATGMQSVVWTDPVEGVSVADESLEWHRVTFDPAAGVTERLASVTLIDGTVVVTARGPAGRFGYGPISIYSQPTG